ncbi:MAG: DNA topoisomerase 3 [Candidatus Obscuribacterales bacterium]|nr:DNA topoisomerase 3 [Candidatus Obscuribacterales bacterium]
MKVILAEKPSVARDIAAVVGANTKRDGYFEGNDYAVTYAFGHLVTIAEPEEMNSAWGKPWRVEQLPMLPSEWKYKVAEKAGAQFTVIKKLFADSNTSSIICATDAGREGEHIFRLIYMLTGCQKPVERLWISSLTADAIRDGLSKLKPSAEFDNLAAAATARAHADWIVGLNFTRAYTTINRNLCTIGRVQTPTLALITERQTLIESFSSKNFYEILATFDAGFTARYITPEAEPQTRLQDKAAAQAIVDAITPIKEGIVESVVTAEKRTKAPALYDLLTLQKEANKRFGYTAQETLNLAQSLYEEYKLISYPRTESRHLSTDMVGELPRILSTVLKVQDANVLAAFAQESIVPGKITASLLKPKLGKAYVDDAKLTDHHAIIPTFNPKPSKLPERQSNIYELVVARFLSIFLPPEVRDETTVIIKLAEHSFRARGVVIKEPGWTVIEPSSADAEQKPAEKGKGKGKAKDKKEGAEDSQQLPALNKAQSVLKKKLELKEGKTTPPKPYDDATLLAAMKNAGQDLDDEDLASYMKQKGLGTPATRAAIIERLLQSGYIERNKKWLMPTEKGKAVIQQVHNDLKDVALTASWEQQLADMQDGNLQLDKFEGEIADLVTRILPDITSRKAVVVAGPKSDPKSIPDGIASCPQCQSGIVRPTAKGVGCNRWREGCNFSVWGEMYGKTLSEAQMKELLEKGRTKTIKGFKKKDGSGTYDAKLVLNEEFKVRMEFEDKGFGPCPQCKEGSVRMTQKGAGCSRWREGCRFFIWAEQFGKLLSEAEIKELFEKKESSLIKGFKKKSGEGTYDARLILTDDFKVRLSFDNQPKVEAAAAELAT